jgi:outer membrane protein TolC
MKKYALLATATLVAGALALAGNEFPSADSRATRNITLDEAVQLAIKQNPQILVAEQEIKRTRGVVIEVTAQALPQVTMQNNFSQEEKYLLLDGAGGGSSSSGGASTSGSNGSGSTMGSSSGASAAATNPTTQSWDVSVTATQLIYSGGQVSSAIHIARFTQDATIYSLRDIVDTTIANVRSQFYAVLLDRAIINVQQQNINLLRSQYTDQKNRFDAGTVPRFNVLQADVAVANALPQLLQAQNDYNVAELNLARSLGINAQLGDPIPPVYPVGELAIDEKPLPLAESMALARERRPYLKEQREQILIQVENIKVALAGYQPRLTADAGYEVRNNEASKALDKIVNGWFFGFTGTWNIWDGGATYGNTKQAKAQLEEAKSNYDDAVRQVDVEVQQALDQVQQSLETITSQEKTIVEAREALRLSQEELNAGTGTQLNVLSAQVSLLQAQTTLVQAQYNYDIAMAQYDRVTAANTHWQELFHDPLVDRQRAQEGLPTSVPQSRLNRGN